ncbi:hypothetical protein ELE36_18950 [Pseudolysobacter antarcticus]|uniref:P/Homo B domain-containing protein n=1 Tax=Pseudolysobacter antarcticus TaxID=2511995 RepID=A0A411HP45_9GAMM|nr:hypothetical protein [Pseudolysobacter antarcticus]QBB72278.1 hypothetical protein ELE36_18950 [Pseudolysobacter antarcticus]
MKIRFVCAGIFLSATLAANSAQAATYSCQALAGTNCPGRVLDGPQAALTSTIQLPPASVSACSGVGGASVTVQLNVTHSWVGDLTASVANGSGSATLLSNLAGAGAGGCQGADVNTTFRDGAGAATCSGQIPAVGGTVSPVTPLAALGGTTSGVPSGAWTLSIADTGNNNDGALIDWSVNVSCAAQAIPATSFTSELLIGLSLAFAAFATLLMRRRKIWN